MKKLFEARAVVLECQAKQRLVEKEIELEHLQQKPKREWQGLTDEEVFDIWLNEMPAPDKVFYQKLCRSVEAKLKEKNA